MKHDSLIKILAECVTEMLKKKRQYTTQMAATSTMWAQNIARLCRGENDMGFTRVFVFLFSQGLDIVELSTSFQQKALARGFNVSAYVNNWQKECEKKAKEKKGEKVGKGRGR